MALSDDRAAEVLRWHTRIRADHPALPGHFPGSPIVPGVVLITEVLRAARALINPPPAVRGFPNIKFLAPVLPEEPLWILLEPGAGGRIRFAIQRESGERPEPVASGLMQCEATAGSERAS